MTDYDLITLGSGGAASQVSNYARDKGWRVAMVEEDRVGGQCLNYGCDPTKTLLETAHLAHLASRAADFGLGIPQVEIDMARIHASWMQVFSRMAGGPDPLSQVRAAGIDVIEGHGRIVAPGRVSVGDREYTCREIMIGTGTHAGIPPIPGLAEAGYWTNIDAVGLTQLPRRLAIIGGGPIGLEFGQLFRRLGCEVTLLEAADRIAITEEPEISALLAQCLRDEGIDVLEGVTIKEVRRRGDERVLITTPPAMTPRQMVDMPLIDRERNLIAQGIAAGGAREIVVDAILVAAGRVPNLTDIGLETVGVETHKRGVVVDDRMQTTVPHIWAAGDITGRYQFTHTSDYQADILKVNMVDGADERANEDLIPWCIFTDPEVAHAGKTVGQLRAEGRGYVTSTYDFADLPRALTLRSHRGIARIIADPSGRLLGVNIAAPEAGSMIGEAMLAMRHGLTVHDIAATMHPYPTMAQGLMRACAQLSAQLRNA